MKKNHKKSTYIVIQMTVVSKSGTNNNHAVLMSNIVRCVKADSKEHAIGKFVAATQDIEAIQKLTIECYNLSELNTLH